MCGVWRKRQRFRGNSILTCSSWVSNTAGLKTTALDFQCSILFHPMVNLAKFSKHAFESVIDQVFCYVLFVHIWVRWSLSSRNSHLIYYFKPLCVITLTALDSKQYHCMLSIHIRNPPLRSNFKTNLLWSQIHFKILNQVCQQRILTCFYGSQMWNSVVCIYAS